MNTNSPHLPTFHTVPEGAVRLPDWGVIRAAGPEAAKFLHSQLTQDFENLQAGQARLAGFCSAKGRLMATFVAWREGPEDVLLACSADLLPAVLKRLSMFVLRAKCKLSDASTDVPLWGLAGAGAQRLLGDSAVWSSTGNTAEGRAIRLPSALLDGQTVPRWLWAGAAAPDLPRLEAPTWQALEASSGVARVVAATAEQFVPQMINLELIGGVNFQKGCYPGQEVVARSQYRGTLKRRAHVVASGMAMVPGQEIFHSADPGQPAGMVVLAGQLDASTHLALAELKLAALEGGSLHAGSAAGPLLSLRSLPYAIPAEAA
jgi:tRNA-modifying protein YgfZ